MDLSFKTGQKVIISLNTGDIFEGEFVSNSNSRVTLRNCCTQTNCTIKGVQYFYRSEIAEISSFESGDTTPNDSTKAGCIYNTTNVMKSINIPEEKYVELKALSHDYIYMATQDSRYFKAVNYITNCETIGVASLSSDLGRASQVDLFVVSTWNQIYLFDIHIYNGTQFPKELKYILECDDIIKVVHDSRNLVDCMFHCNNIKVANIFDTFVAARMISNMELRLDQCLTKYFNFPGYLLREALDPSLRAEWNKRPLENDIKENAAKQVQYLITLKNFLQKELLKDFYQNVKEFSESTLTSSPLEAQLAIGKLNIE